MTSRTPRNRRPFKKASRPLADYETMDEAELKQVASIAHQQLANRILERTGALRKEHAALMARITQAMAPYGLTPHDFLTLPRSTLRRAIVARLRGDVHSPLAPPYRHPQHPELTWSGRGTRPKWLRTLLAKGHSLDEFRVERNQPNGK
jgi:DNA-binding protein H-NS